MDVQSLIRLAHQADLEGNYKVADKLTERAVREAQFLRNIGRQLGDFFGNMNVGRGAKDIANQSLNIGTGNAGGGGGGVVQQMVGAAADASNDFKLKSVNKGARTVLVTLPDGRQVPTTGNMNRLLPILDQLSPEDQAIVRARARGMGNLRSQQTAQAGASASAAADASGGDAMSGIAGGLSKADRFKSHNITGITGPAAMGLTAITALLGGYGMYLMNGRVVDQRGNPVPPQDIPAPVKNLMESKDFKANQLSARTSAGQMGNQQAAQNFIEARKGNPAFKTAQDFYNDAKNKGLNQSMINQITALAKAEGYRDLTPFTF